MIGFWGVSGERSGSLFAHGFDSGAFGWMWGASGSFRELSLLGLALEFPVSASSH